MTYISFYKQLDFRSVDCRPLLNFGFLFLFVISDFGICLFSAVCRFPFFFVPYSSTGP